MEQINRFKTIWSYKNTLRLPHYLVMRENGQLDRKCSKLNGTHFQTQSSTAEYKKNTLTSSLQYTSSYRLHLGAHCFFHWHSQIHKLRYWNTNRLPHTDIFWPCPCTDLRRVPLHHTVAKLTIKHTKSQQRKAWLWQRPLQFNML